MATAAVRGAHHLLAHEVALWLLLVADDLSMIVSHSRNRESVLLGASLPSGDGLPAVVEEAGRRRDPSKWPATSWSSVTQRWGSVRHGRSSSKGGIRDSSETRLCRCRSSKRGRTAFVHGALDYDRPVLATTVSVCSKRRVTQCEAAPTFRPADACGTSAERFHSGAIACVNSPERAGHKHGGW